MSYISSSIALTCAVMLSACSSAEQTAAPQATADAAKTAPAAASPAPGTRSAPVVPGRPGRVFIFAAVDAKCAPIPAPEVAVTKPPIKGDVSFKPGQDTEIATSAQGTCIGSKTKGTGVYYTARAGTSGLDAFTVTAKLASGETMTREFTVKIAE